MRTGWWLVGQDATVSNALRTLYLVEKQGSSATGSYQAYIEKVTGKWGADLRAFVIERSLAFARPWYAKAVEASRGTVGSAIHDPSLNKEGLLKGLLAEFGQQHAENERKAAGIDKLDAAIAKFLPMLAGKVQ